MTDISNEARKALIGTKNRIWGGPEEWVILEHHVPHIWCDHHLSRQLVLLPSPVFIGQFLKWAKNHCDQKRKKNSYIQRHHYDHYHYHLTKSDTKELFARYSRLAVNKMRHSSDPGLGYFSCS